MRTRIAVRTARLAAGLSRRLRRGEGAIIGGRVAVAVDPQVLERLAAGRRVVLVTGTNGKTTVAHLLAAALRTLGPVAHNDTGANMVDGVVAALMARPEARRAVLEVDELHLAAVAEQVQPAAVVLLNLTRDQLDRSTEVAAVAGAIRAGAAEPTAGAGHRQRGRPGDRRHRRRAAGGRVGRGRRRLDRGCRTVPALWPAAPPDQRALGLPGVRAAPSGAGLASWPTAWFAVRDPRRRCACSCPVSTTGATR